MTQGASDDYELDDGPTPDDPMTASGAGTARVPPHDLDAEAMVLSAVLYDPERIASIDFLQAAHFYSERHRRIYEAVLEVRTAGGPVDHGLVAIHLKESGRLAQVGGIPYLVEIMDSAPVIANVRQYALTVYERCRLRDTILACERIAARGYDPGIGPAQAFIDDATKTMASIGRNSPLSLSEPNWAVLRRMMAAMVEVAKLEPGGGRTPGLPTGIRSLDLKMLGLQPGKKITVMAERGRGKTSFALQVAMHAAGWRGRRQALADRRVAVVFFSGEMSKAELAIKQLALAARVDSLRLERQMAEPTLSDEEWARVVEAMPLLEQLRITVDDRGDLTADQVTGAIRQACSQSLVVDGLPMGLAVVDYIQRLRIPPELLKRREDEQIGHGTQALKNCASGEQIPILELAQMNTPDPKLAKTGRPYAGLVAQCKRIEKEADAVLCLWRKQKADLRNYALTCTKMRGGVEFEDLDLEFEPEFSTFVDPAYKGFRSAFEDFA